jgi:hypothetical protein
MSHNHHRRRGAYGPNPYEGQGVRHHYHHYGEAPGVGPTNAAHRHPGADSLIKGLVIGAGVAYLLTNEHAQRTLLKTAAQLWTVVQTNLEEWKERLHDAEAEVAAAATAAAAPPQTSDEKGSPSS